MELPHVPVTYISLPIIAYSDCGRSETRMTLDPRTLGLRDRGCALFLNVVPFCEVCFVKFSARRRAVSNVRGFPQFFQANYGMF
jgi:hypothetical protein